MNATTYTDLRQNLNLYMDKVIQDNEPLIVTRKNNENVVLISINEYNSLVETNYLLSNETNAEHIRKSIEQHKTVNSNKPKIFCTKTTNSKIQI